MDQETLLTQELNNYCLEHDLPELCSLELQIAICAALAGAGEEVATPTTKTRRKELNEAQTWLTDFNDRWEVIQPVF